MLFLRIFHRLMLLVLGHGAGRHVLLLELHPIPLSEMQSEKEGSGRMSQFTVYLISSPLQTYTEMQPSFFYQNFLPPSHFIQVFHLWLKIVCYINDKIKNKV